MREGSLGHVNTKWNIHEESQGAVLTEWDIHNWSMGVWEYRNHKYGVEYT